MTCCPGPLVSLRAKARCRDTRNKRVSNRKNADDYITTCLGKTLSRCMQRLALGVCSLSDSTGEREKREQKIGRRKKYSG